MTLSPLNGLSAVRRKSDLVPKLEVDMKKGKQILRKADPLMLLTALVAAGVLFTTVVDAGEGFRLGSLDFADILDGDVTMAQVGRSGAGLHLSVESASGKQQLLPASRMSAREQMNMPGVFLSVRAPW